MADNKKDSLISRRNLLKLFATTTIGSTLVGGSGLFYSIQYEPNNLDITQIHLTLPRLDPEFNGYRLVQISDIHIGPWMTQEKLQNIVNAINDLEPDAIAITGDFVTNGSDKPFYDELVTPLKTLSFKDTTVAVLGNHDHTTNAPRVREIIRDSGLNDVSNDVFTVERNGKLLHLAGVDDIWEQQNDLESVLQKTPTEGCAILLAHEPDYADVSAETGRFDLQISGHSHGGQIILPFIGPWRLPPMANHYPIGQYQVGNMIQYTNRGLGMIQPLLRFNCTPEITVFTLQSQGS